MGLKVTRLDDIADLTEEALRDEAEGWEDEDTIECGSAIITPDDGSGVMEGFVRVDARKGMVCWGGELSNWIEAEDLDDLFKKYAQDMT
jgi:hypothetical protein